MFRGLRIAQGSRRRGAVAVVVAVTMVPLIGFAALAIDLSYIETLRGEMQRTVDAAALAGASGLSLGNDVAESRALEYVANNLVGRQPVARPDVEVTVGYWSSLSQTFTPSVEGFRPNAVRVVGTRTDIPLFFAPVLGIETARVEKTAIAVYYVSDPCSGVWGLEGITGNGNITTDSYNSLDGSYGSAGVFPNGDLCSCQDVELSGDVLISGDVMHGDGYDTLINGSAAEVYGAIEDLSCDSLVPPSFDMTAAAHDNDNANIPLTDRGLDPFRGRPFELRLESSDNLTLPPGDYYFETVRMSGTATITVTGPTRIFVSGSASFAGNGFINQSQDPHDLTIYSSGLTLTVTGTSGFAGSIIAPQTDLILPGTSEYYGAIIARTVDLGGTVDIHVDESVVQALMGPSTSQVELVQ